MTTAQDPSPPTASTSRRQRYRDMIHRLAWRFDHDASSGDLAQLRRLDVRHGFDSLDTAFWRIVIHDLEDQQLLDGYDDGDDLRRWMAILQGLATLQGQRGQQGQHAKGQRLGQAMAAAEISEVRLVRLLRAQGDALLALIRTLAHQLRSKGTKVDWADVADLLFSEERSYATDVRRDISSDFYRQQYRDTTRQDADGAAT